tara:strand:- start:12678 stop:13079 length:402 start_codon:yes stop_codon:yes gene_type:complete
MEPEFGHYEEQLYFRIVNSKHWEWIDGMAFIHADEVRAPVQPKKRYVEGMKLPDTPIYPSLEDAATKGCLLEQLRKVYQRTDIYTEKNHAQDTWELWLGSAYVGGGKTEGTALAEALLFSDSMLRNEETQSND